MKNFKKGFVNLILIIVIVILAGLVGYLTLVKKTLTSSTTKINQQDYIKRNIERNKIGPFNIGDSMPSQEMFAKLGYEVKEQKEEGLRETEGGPKGSAFIVSQNGKELLIIYPFNNMISELKIISPEFKTDEGISIGSTITEFVNAYPTHKIWYTYVGDWFILDTPKYGGAQFKLDRNGFINTKKNILSSESVTLLLSDFNSDTKITDIRIYYSPE